MKTLTDRLNELKYEVEGDVADEHFAIHSVTDEALSETATQIIQDLLDIVGEDDEQNIYRDRDYNLMCSTCNGEVFGGICDCSGYNQLRQQLRQKIKQYGGQE